MKEQILSLAKQILSQVLQIASAFLALPVGVYGAHSKEINAWMRAQWWFGLALVRARL
jgi:hypothetical protein